MFKTTLNIEGMMCGMCEAHISDVIRKTVPDAKKVYASHSKGIATFLSEAIPSEEELKNAIAKTGYSCLSVESVPHEKNGKVEEMMKTDYKNWMPKGMVMGSACGAALLLIGSIVVALIPIAEPVKKVLVPILFVVTAIFLVVTIWMYLMYRAFSYNGKRKMSKQIIEGVASYVNLPDGGKGLDVGCGSGALTIACAKRNPKASFTGIDRWGKEYASFSKALCENNSKAEGVSNTSFMQGDAVKLPFDDETFDAVTSNYVYHNIPSSDRQAILLETLRTLKKGGTFAIHDIMSKMKYGDMQVFAKKLKDMGYTEVKLVDTTNGIFMSRWESAWMGLSGSTILVGRK